MTAKDDFEKRLYEISLPYTMKPKFTIWYVWKNITIRSYKDGYSVHFWVDTPEYAGRKQLYVKVDYSCSNEKFLLNLLGRRLKEIPNE